jgi:hypothetical protein
MLSTLQNFFKPIRKTQERVINWIFLHIIYALGIGVTGVVAKIFGKKLIGQPKLASNWQTHQDKVNLETMF